MPLHKLLFFIAFMVSFSITAQSIYTIEDADNSDKIRFELINNVMIIPVEVNGLALKFILDTGVNKPIVFNFLKESDSLKILNSEKIQLKGLGDGDYIDALKSSHNTFKIGNAINKDQGFFAIFDSKLNFAPKLGLAIDGIIGYDIFKDFIVEINYTRQFIKLHNPKTYIYKNCKKCDAFNLEFKRNKPYVNANVEKFSKSIPVKLLIDSGGSDALWLFENEAKGLRIGNRFFEDFLGTGLSGDVYGKRTKADAFKLGKFTFKNPKVAFPDSSVVASVRRFKDRDGTLGGDILRRFNCIVDYPNSKLTLKPNSLFKLPFSYNKSGLQIEHDGVRLVMEIDLINNGAFAKYTKDSSVEVQTVIKTNYKYSVKPSFVIKKIRANSPAAKAGLLEGDIVLSINRKATSLMTLDKIINKFYQEEGKQIRITVGRYGEEYTYTFILESPIK